MQKVVLVVEMELRLLECFSPVLVLLLCSNLDRSAVVSVLSLLVCQVTCRGSARSSARTRGGCCCLVTSLSVK